MPVAKIQTPDGRIVTLEVPEGATEQQILEFVQSQELPVPETSLAEDAIGTAEVVGSVLSGAVADPISGLAGIVQSLNPFADQGAGVEAIEATRDFLTFDPRTEAGQRQMQELGQFLQPVGEALQATESFLGDNTFEALKDLGASDELASGFAAAATTLPTAALEILGVKGSRKAVSPGRASARQVRKAVVESAPEIEAIKSAARGIYSDIDNAGVRVKEQALRQLAKNVAFETRKAGLDPRTTPRAAGAVDAIRDVIDSPQTLTEVDTLRKIAQNVAGVTDLPEKNLGRIIIEQVDDFLDNLNPSDLVGGKGSDTAKQFKVARELWGRARRAEVINDAIQTGVSRAAGPEAGIRNELNRLLNNKKTSKFIPAAEKRAIRDVVEGNFSQNLTRLIGKLGISVDRSPNLFQSMIAGGGSGFLIGGAPGAITIPAVGTVSKEISKRLTKNRARFVERITRAGTDGQRIAKAYLESVPKGARRVDDLAELLSDPNVNISALEDTANETIRKAYEMAQGRRELASAATALAIPQLTGEENG